MSTQFKATFTNILLAITVAAASGVVEAGKGNGGGSQSGGGFGSGNGAMYGPGPTMGNGYQTRNSNQYRYQNQHRYHKGDGTSQKDNMHSTDSGIGQYSNDKYLNQKDFQAWLNQNQSKAQNQTQNQNQVQNMAQDGI